MTAPCRLFTSLAAAAILCCPAFAQIEMREITESPFPGATVKRYLAITGQSEAEPALVFVVAGTRRTSLDFLTFTLQVVPEVVVPIGRMLGGEMRIEIPAKIAGHFYVQALMLEVKPSTFLATPAMDIGDPGVPPGDTEG